jgi:hypothetical protein
LIRDNAHQAIWTMLAIQVNGAGGDL